MSELSVQVRTMPEAGPPGRVGRRPRRSASPASPRRRPARIMSFSSWLRMWQCQTYSQPKLATSLVDRSIGLPSGSMLVKPSVEPIGSAGSSGRKLLGTLKGRLVGRRRDRPQRHDRVLQRADPDRVLPAQLVGVGQPDGPVPADAVDELHVEQVEVDRVGVDTVVGDLPDLRAVRPAGLRSECEPTSLMSSVGGSA